MEELHCLVERITYHSPENGYTVLRCTAKGYQDEVTLVGNMAEVHVGSELKMQGFWKVNTKYGPQFSFTAYEETLPATIHGIERYLGGGLIKGVGPAFAKKIVKQFGEDTLRVLEQEPGKLLSVPGIGKRRVEKIISSWAEQKEVKNIMLFLQDHDVSTSHASKIYKTYGNESLKVVRENPYRLADDIWGIGFKTADQIAQKLGFGPEREERLRSGLLYTLGKLSEEGHCYGTKGMVIEEGVKLLEVSVDLLSAALEKMIQAEDVVVEVIPERGRSLAGNNPSQKTEGNSKKATGEKTENGAGENKEEKAIYLPPFYYAEVGTANKLSALLSHPASVQVKEEGLLDRIAARTGLSYDEVQKKAILQAVRSKVLVLTGGPGTGKTTTTLGILKAYQEAGAKILLAAPTGRAAKRLSETAGMEAKTIHRLLEVTPPAGYQKNEENPLEGDVLIVDECSMIDVVLMNALLKALPLSMRLILVGDADQLPSVGPGNVLRDICEAGRFPVVRLTRIFRQAQESKIIMGAHLVNAGKFPDLTNPKGTDFFFVDIEQQAIKKGLDERDNMVLAYEGATMVAELVSKILPKRFQVPPTDIQVLVPMQRSLVGATNLNQRLQETLNPSQTGLKRGGFDYREGDKVMQIRNNYDKEVFNGDIGSVVKVDLEERELTALFDGREVRYDVADLDELVLAYATTIHKAQGSEYPYVVMPILMNHFAMLQRNLVYTGITRAKKGLVIVGTTRAIWYAVRNVQVDKRQTMLRERLSRYQELLIEKESPKETPAKEQQEKPAEKQKMSYEEWLTKDLWDRIRDSTYRSGFSLSEADKALVREKGWKTISSQAVSLVRKMAKAGFTEKAKDSGHPLYLALYGTGCESRKSLSIWHHIPQERDMTEEEIKIIAKVLLEWILRQMKGEDR